MKDTPMVPAVGTETDRLIRTADVMLEVHRMVTGESVRAALHQFRRWDHLVRKPLAVGDWALSSKEATGLLHAAGVPSGLIDGIFDMFARRKHRSNCWSRAVGGFPERRADALELFAGLALTCRATVEEKLSIVFSLFECRETGFLVEHDLGALISSCASFLCRLGLSIPISNDEAAFVAGGVLARTQESPNTCKLKVGEIGLPGFLLWAQKATLPVRALELLTLPHRLSGALGLVSATLSLLRERYSTGGGAGDCARSPCQPRCSKLAPLKRASGFLRAYGVGGRNLSLVLPPVLCRVSSHDAKVMVEASPSGAPTAAGSIWHAVATIEERSGSRFFVVDSQPIILRGAVPTVLLFSELHAGTDHRVQLSWNVCKPQRQRGQGRCNVRNGKQGRRTLRFTTLSETSTTVRSSQTQMGVSPTCSPRWESDSNARRSIKVIIDNFQTPGNDLLGVFPPRPSSAGAKSPKKAISGRKVSVAIRYQQPTSLESTDEHLDMRPWWGIPRPPNGSTSSEINPSAMPSRQQNGQPLIRAADPDLAKTSTPGLAPFNGENLKLPTSGEVQSQCWGAKGSESGDIDVVVHLSPGWRAMGAIRRCFHILEKGRFESSAVRKDGRSIAAREATKAVRSLFRRTCQFQRRTPSDPGRQSCAHVVLGVPHPWLGLEEEEVLTYDEEHRAFVRLAVESAFQSCIWDAKMCNGGSSCISTDGDRMKIGDGCLLLRPGKRQNGVDEPSGLEVSSTGAVAAVVTAARSVESTEGTAENMSGVGPVERLAGSGSEDEASLLCNERSAEKGEEGTKLPEEGSGEDVGDTAGVAEDILVRGLGEARTGMESGSTSPKGVDHSGLAEDKDGDADFIHSEEQAPDLDESDESANGASASDNLERNPTLTLERNPTLRALMQDITKAGAATGLPSVGKAGSRSRKVPGPTVIILLDAPLLSPEDPWLFPRSKAYYWVSQNASDMVVRRNDVHKGASEHAETPRGSRGILPPVMAESCDVGDQDGADLRGDDQHAAGLGDPKEALEALLSWVEEGGVSHSGGREIILVCGNDPQGKETAKYLTQRNTGAYDDSGPEGGASGGSETGSANSSTREGEIHARVQSADSGSTPSDKDWQGGVHEGDVTVVEEEKTAPDHGQLDDGADMIDHEREAFSSSGPTIRQIILGKPFTPNVGQTVRPRVGKNDVPHAINRLWDRGETMARKSTSDGPSLSAEGLISETHPASTKDSQNPGPAHPSTVLLEVRPTQIGGEARVVVTFPPPMTPSVAPAGHIGTVTSIPSGSHEEETSKGGEEPVRCQQQLPRVLMGPVVGRVGPNSAVLLVEVDMVDAGAAAALGKLLQAAASDTVGVQLTDALSGRQHEVTGGRWAGEPGSGPRVFEFEQLTPGRRYAIRLMGVRQRDQVARTGGLSTPLETEGPSAIWGFSPFSCPGSALEEMLADIQTTRSTATVGLAVGPMVDSSKVAESLYPQILAEKEVGAQGLGGDTKGASALGARALRAFRQLYRCAWEEPRMRKLLANTSTVPSGGAGDLLFPILSRFPSGWLPPPSTHAPHRWSRGAHWRGDVDKGFKIGGVARALSAVAKAASQASEEYLEVLSGGSPCGGSSLTGNKGGHGDRGLFEQGPLPRFQRWGAVGVLNVSVLSSQVELAFGRRTAGRQLLSAEAKAWLDEFFLAPGLCLQEGPGLNTLIITTDSPLLWQSASAPRSSDRHTPPQTETCGGVGPDQSTSSEGESGRYRHRRPPVSNRSRDSPSWSSHPREAASFLALLFAWAANNPEQTQTTKENAKGQRAFVILCPADRVRTNIETYVKDHDTGRVAVQWCLASKETGNEAFIPMSGSIGPRFSFTHYPRVGDANGPGTTLLRPIPDVFAPSVTFLGMSPRECGGPGLALGTLGPVLGEVGTTTARVLVEVSVPMELRLTVQKAGGKKGKGLETQGQWQELKKVIRKAHRPVVFEVGDLIPDTRYHLHFSPLANASTFRASLQTRAVRPVSFRVAAFGGSGDPFGFADFSVPGDGSARRGTGKSRDQTVRGVGLRERWPFRAVAAPGRKRSASALVGGASSEMQIGPGRKKNAEKGRGGREAEAYGGGREAGGWRIPISTAVAIGATTDEAKLAEMQRESLLGEGSYALPVCEAFCDRSAWKVLADEVQLPARGLDLIIHMGNEINAAACLNGEEIAELARNSARWMKPSSSETSRSAERGIGFPQLVHPPQLPTDGDKLGSRDEKDVSKMEAFLIQVHNKAERTRKRGGDDNQSGGSRDSIQEPLLDLHGLENEGFVSGVNPSGVHGGGIVEGGELEQAGSGPGERRSGLGDVHQEGDVEDGAFSDWHDAGAWALVADEVAERVRDPYRVAWGLPWAAATMASAPNASLAFTPLVSTILGWAVPTGGEL